MSQRRSTLSASQQTSPSLLSNTPLAAPFLSNSPLSSSPLSQQTSPSLLPNSPLTAPLLPNSPLTAPLLPNSGLSQNRNSTPNSLPVPNENCFSKKLAHVYKDFKVILENGQYFVVCKRCWETSRHKSCKLKCKDHIATGFSTSDLYKHNSKIHDEISQRIGYSSALGSLLLGFLMLFISKFFISFNFLNRCQIFPFLFFFFSILCCLT